jgi:hypothetical protein
VLSLRHFGLAGWFSLSLGAWVPKTLARRNRKTRRLLTNRPCSSSVYEESDSKERLRVSNWIVQRLYNYAVKKTVELRLLTVFQHVVDPTRVRTIADKNSAVTPLDLRPTLCGPDSVVRKFSRKLGFCLPKLPRKRLPLPGFDACGRIIFGLLSHVTTDDKLASVMRNVSLPTLAPLLRTLPLQEMPRHLHVWLAAGLYNKVSVLSASARCGSLAPPSGLAGSERTKRLYRKAPRSNISPLRSSPSQASVGNCALALYCCCLREVRIS